MLVSTSEALARAGIKSLPELEHRLYEELGSANTADLMNQAIGELFSNAYKCLCMVAAGSASSQYGIRKEQARIIFSSDDASRIGMPDSMRIKRLPEHSLLFKTHQDSLSFSKTLLGEMVGDIFAVQGVYAGSDQKLGEPAAYLLGRARYNGPYGLSAPFISLLVLEWANLGNRNPVLGSLTDTLFPRGEWGVAGYEAVRRRIGRLARELDNKHVIRYKSRGWGRENVYISTGTWPLPDKLPDTVGRDAVVSVRDALLGTESPASEIAGRLHYTISYIKTVIHWLVENGYAEIAHGLSKKENSAILPTWRSRRLCGYVDEPLSLLGFNSNKMGSVWEPPRIDAAGIASYRRHVVDPVCADGPENARFEEMCRISYKRHAARFHDLFVGKPVPGSF